jgi:hypothetical protein
MRRIIDVFELVVFDLVSIFTSHVDGVSLFLICDLRCIILAMEKRTAAILLTLQVTYE